MQELTAILEFKEVTLHPASSQVFGLMDISFALGRGEIALIKLEEGREHNPLAALAQGLITPDQGRVYFTGADWAEMRASRQATCRGRIRRVFEHYGWTSNLDVIENLCLAECYHTKRAMTDIEEEVRGLARRFGVDPIPDARPSRVHHMVLRKLEWVRAFVGTPDLIILERPLFGAPRGDAMKLIEAACEAARRGVSILWCFEDEQVMDCRELAHARRLRMDGERLTAS